MTVKLSASLPKDSDRNGLEVLHRRMVAHPIERHLVVMVIDTARKIIDYNENGTETPVAGVLYIEPVIDAEDVETITEIIARTRAERLGDGTLDFDFGLSPDGDPLAPENIVGTVVTIAHEVRDDAIRKLYEHGLGDLDPDDEDPDDAA